MSEKDEIARLTKELSELKAQLALRSSAQAPAQVNFYSAIGSIPEYKIDQDWDTYQERFGEYFKANQLPEDRKVSVLITLIGEEAYKTLKNLCTPTAPAEKTYKELCDILSKQFSP